MSNPNILAVTELIGKRRFTVDAKFDRHYTRVFQVRVSNPLVGGLEVQAADGLPKLYFYYVTENEHDLGATAREITPQQTEDPYVWEVTFEYSSERVTSKWSENPLTHGDGPPGSPNKGNASEQDPTKWAPKIGWNTERYQKPSEKDIKKKPKVSSSFEKFDPPIEMDDSRQTLTIERYELFYDDNRMLDFQDTLNEKTFFGKPPGTVKFYSAPASSEFLNKIWCWKVTYTFHIRKLPPDFKDTKRGPWVTAVLDQGFKELIGGVPTLIIDKQTMSPLSSPALLDGNGNQLAPGADPVYLYFDDYETRDFNLLNLP